MMSFYDSVQHLVRYRIHRTKNDMRILELSLLIMLSFAIITFSNSSHLSFAQNSTSFVSSFEKLVKKVNNLSQSYHNETGKFVKGQINNKTMIAITDNYLPKFQNLVKESKALQPPKQYQNATDLYTKSLESELQSNNHFRNYISTNNSTDNKLSSKLLSDAFNYETEAFKKLKASGSFTIVP
jgi:flagellar hook-basal body complex protein FliE